MTSDVVGGLLHRDGVVDAVFLFRRSATCPETLLTGVPGHCLRLLPEKTSIATSRSIMASRTFYHLAYATLAGQRDQPAAPERHLIHRQASPTRQGGRETLPIHRVSPFGWRVGLRVDAGPSWGHRVAEDSENAYARTSPVDTTGTNTRGRSADRCQAAFGQRDLYRLRHDTSADKITEFVPICPATGSGLGLRLQPRGFSISTEGSR